MNPENLTDAIELWSGVALELGWAPKWVEGAILPREMVFFLARAQSLGQTRIVESGRQDGYSTMILGEYARRVPGVEIHSIDFEEDAERARRCRERLAAYPDLILHRGDANRLIPRILRADGRKPTALLVDGPKGFWALSLMLASLRFPGVGIVSLHNLSPGKGYRAFFERFRTDGMFHEDFGFNGPSWTRLAEEERAVLDRIVPGRSAESSTLGVLRVTPDVRRRSASAVDTRFRLYQPPLVRLGWSFGLDTATSSLFSLSFRLWRA